MPDIGHNSGFAKQELVQFLDRIDKINAEIKELQAFRRDIFSEAAASGFDKKAIREILKLRAMKPAERAEREEIRDIYKMALDLV